MHSWKSKHKSSARPALKKKKRKKKIRLGFLINSTIGTAPLRSEVAAELAAPDRISTTTTTQEIPRVTSPHN